MTQAGTRKPVLLAVDDEEKNLRVLERLFSEDYDVRTAGDGQDALDKARALKPDVIITDQRMPKVSGVEFLATLRDELPHCVRVLITAYTDYEPLVDAVNAAGVHKYIEKPFHVADLQTTVDALYRAQKLEAEREDLVARLAQANEELAQREKQLEKLVDERTRELSEANVRLREMAVRDSLTGLFNHRYMLENLQIEIARAKRYDRKFCVLFLDVDNFKTINDTYGHAAGDAVLCDIAAFLRPQIEGLRSSDFAARYGGEEFCVILPETPLDGGVIKAERIRESVTGVDWGTKHEALAGATITVSIGVAAYPEHGDSVQSILGAADAAQYDAKRGGKNAVKAATTKA